MGFMAHAGRWADPFTARTLCEFVLLTALLMVFGLAAFIAAVMPAQVEWLPAARRLWIIVRASSLTALVMAPITVISGAAAMAGTRFIDGAALLPKVIERTRFGSVWLAAAPILVLIAAAAWIAPASRRRAAAIALAAAGMLAARSFVSHAIDFGPAAVLCYFIHQAAAGLWGGALLGLLIASAQRGVEPAAGNAIAWRVSRLAGWSVAVLVTSGLYLAYRALGLNLDHLLYSAYGRTLVAKVTVFGLLAGLGGYNRYQLLPRLEAPSMRARLINSVRVECAAMLAVAALAVLLANTPPSH